MDILKYTEFDLHNKYQSEYMNGYIDNNVFIISLSLAGVFTFGIISMHNTKLNFINCIKIIILTFGIISMLLLALLSFKNIYCKLY